MKKIHIGHTYEQKNNIYSDYLLQKTTQLNILKQLYMENEEDTKKMSKQNDDLTLVKRELNNKISGYKQQDKLNSCYDTYFFISLNKVYELLITSRLNCFYCKQTVAILYNNKKQPNQWTLDRIDNEQGHNDSNCVIACLQCNLNRKKIDSNKFLFTKQMKLIKKDH